MTYAFILACIAIAVLLIVVTAMTVSLREHESTIAELDADRDKLATDLALAKRNSLPYEAELLRDTTDPLFSRAEQDAREAPRRKAILDGINRAAFRAVEDE